MPLTKTHAAGVPPVPSSVTAYLPLAMRWRRYWRTPVLTSAVAVAPVPPPPLICTVGGLL